MTGLKAGDYAFVVKPQVTDDGNMVAVVSYEKLDDMYAHLVGVLVFSNEIDANIARDKANIVINMRRYEGNQGELRRRLDRRQGTV